ncbi:MAG: IS1634 family transposase [Candidatus Marinimicrobia bacterium]|jgi:transposase|nr:IS1634 family transposase [Candidatus Neomarinimicrobiota bacterium]
MFIRRTAIKSRRTGDSYFTHRLVESIRTEKGVRQRTLLNLGVNFPFPRENWSDLSSRIEEIITGQNRLIALDSELETAAQRYSALLIKAQSRVCESIQDNTDLSSPDFHRVDLNSLEHLRPRSVGVEHIALSTLQKLGLDKRLQEYGLTSPQLNAAIGVVIARLTKPGSERSTHNWLQNHSGLGELLGWDFGRTSLTRLYEVSDQLLRHKDALEQFLFQQERKLFDFEETIVLYDLTNTYFEGQGANNPKAENGRSKEKRSDCPLVTLGLVLDGSGFPMKSNILAGNISEPGTLATILENLEQKVYPTEKSRKSTDESEEKQLVLTGVPTVVMDAGIASEDNIKWLVEHGHHYIVVSRKRHREFDSELAVLIKDTPSGQVKAQRVVNKNTGEVELYCHSHGREKKETAILDRCSKRYEEGLEKMAAGLKKKRGCRDTDKIHQRLGRLKEKHARAAQNYEVTVEVDQAISKVVSITWSQTKTLSATLSHPGVYCLRTNQKQWDESTIWNTYTMLTDLEGVFRSLKSELGLRPVYHQIEKRVDGHLFISLLAYHIVHSIRYQLKGKGIHDSWESLRTRLSGQERITSAMKLENGQQVHIRKSSRPEPRQQIIYDALGLPHLPGKSEKTFI